MELEGAQYNKMNKYKNSFILLLLWLHWIEVQKSSWYLKNRDEFNLGKKQIITSVLHSGLQNF